MNEEYTIVQYAQDNLEPFDLVPFNEVDSLILSCVAYLRLPLHPDDHVLLKDLYEAEYFSAMFHNVYSAPHSKDLFAALCASPRFRDIEVFHYIQDSSEESTKQFSALCFQCNEDLAYVAFRGTDATLLGWKEDFNMAFTYPVASQYEAANYLHEVIPSLKGKILVGGHSKGGNLAVYACMHQETIDRIDSIYTHDGPGFPKAIFQSRAYHKIASKIQKTVPQSCVIGMILEYQENYEIIKSNRFSVWQHDPYSWLVAKDHFIRIDRLSYNALYVNTTTNVWLTNITPKERERFIETLYSLIWEEDIKTSAQFKKNLPKNLPKIIQAAKDLNPDTKRFLRHTLQQLTKLSVASLPKTFRKKTK